LTELWETVEALERRLGEGEQEPPPPAAADAGEGGQP